MAGLARRGSIARKRPRPLLLKYGQDLGTVSWFISNAARAGTRPFDGVFLYLPTSSNGVMATASQDETTVSTEMSTFHSASLGNLAHNFPVVRWTNDTVPDWWNDTHWATIADNWAAFGAGVQGARVAGLAFDNEYYGAGTTPFDWVNGGGIDPTHTLSESQGKVRQRGEECMTALLAEWPDVRLILLHGPYISDPRTGVDVWTDTDTDPPFWNPVDFANELSAWFTFGMLDATLGTPARVYDGGETYGVRSLQAVRNVRDWQLRGMPSGSTIVPAALQGAAYKIGAAQGLGDFDEFNSFDPLAASAIEDQIGWSLLNSDIVWFYTEENEWWEGFTWGDHVDIDQGTEVEIWNAVANGKATGQRTTVGQLRSTFGTLTVGGSTTTCAANTKYGSKFTSTEDVDVSYAFAYLDGAGSGTGDQLTRVLIYPGDGTATAGALTGTSDEVTITDGQAAGWVKYTFDPAVTLAAGTWWLHLHCGTNTNTIQFYRGATTDQAGQLGDTYSNGPGDPGGTQSLTPGPYSIHVAGDLA